MRGFTRLTSWLAKMLNWVAGWCLVGMMGLTSADILLRLFRRPILGTYEIVGFLGAVVAGFAMAQTTIERGHVAVQVVVTKFSSRVQEVIYLITHLLSVVLFALLAWECARYGDDLRTSGEVSLTLQLPFFPVLYGIAFSAAIVCLVLVVDILLVITRGAEAWYRWEE
ncbi:MAG: TRAP transporter small permease [Deltaproteobacteria bacterium]|nr:MAG: TRAP transporter small permease [Deltaproteobacteria bacterium]